MLLSKLMNKRRLVIMGLNSGTSADGVDLAALKIVRNNKGVVATFINGASQPYPSGLRLRILKLSDSKSTTLEELIAVDSAVGTFFGQSAARFIKKLSKSGIMIDAVGSHGQTVRHIPTATDRTKHVRGTLQIGSLERISSATKKITVGDFRQADVALGNEGAPITVAAMQRLFGSKTQSRLIVNIGGIANYFYYPLPHKGLRPLAGDCGPGNGLCDILSERFFNKRFDSNGDIAASGQPSKRILSLLLAEPFFKSKTISTGRETFGKDFADTIVRLGKKLKLSKADLVSTAAELTVVGIVHKIRPLMKRDASLSKLYLTGGGRKNNFFVKRLKQMLTGVEILAADELGFNADYIEAASYAVMGEACLRSEPVPTVCDKRITAALKPVLGKIVQPPVKI